MPILRGKCTNSDCDMSLEESIEIADGKDFVCPSCERPLQSLIADRNQPSTKATLGSGRNPARAKLFLAVLGLSVISSGWGIMRWIQGDPKLQISPLEISLPLQLIDKSVSSELTLTNIGTGTLAIDSVKSTDPEITLSSSSLRLKPQESRPITLTFLPKTSGKKTSNIEFHSNEQLNPIVTVSLTSLAIKHDARWIWQELDSSSSILTGAQ